MKRTLRFFLLLWCPLGVSVAADTGWTLNRLMASLANVDVIEARFSEKKTLAILKEPLVTTGILNYRAPDYLKKQTLWPHEESYEVSEGWLEIETSAESKRQVELKGYPEIQAFVESIRATLAGDLDSLKRYYRLQLLGVAADWTLRLEPLDAGMAEYVAAIVIRGRENRVLAVETLDADGDRSVMTITPMQ